MTKTNFWSRMRCSTCGASSDVLQEAHVSTAIPASFLIYVSPIGKLIKFQTSHNRNTILACHCATPLIKIQTWEPRCWKGFLFDLQKGQHTHTPPPSLPKPATIEGHNKVRLLAFPCYLHWSVNCTCVHVPTLFLLLVLQQNQHKWTLLLHLSHSHPLSNIWI